MKLTQERLKELLDYDPETVVFIWKIDVIKHKTKGKVAGCLNKDNGYIQISIGNKGFLAHRLAFLWREGYWPENQIDHIDRNRVNNKWSNLREVSASCNRKNSNISKNSSSGITGIGWVGRSKKWQVQIKINNKSIYLGMFENIIDAAKARWKAELKYNFPNCNTTSSAYNYLKDHGVL